MVMSTIQTISGGNRRTGVMQTQVPCDKICEIVTKLMGYMTGETSIWVIITPVWKLLMFLWCKWIGRSPTLSTSSRYHPLAPWADSSHLLQARLHRSVSQPHSTNSILCRKLYRPLPMDEVASNSWEVLTMTSTRHA